MSQSRRSILGALTALPFTGKAVAEQAISGGIGGNMPLQAPSGSYPSAAGSVSIVERAPKMLRDQAYKLICQSPSVIEQIRSEFLQNELNSNPYIDPDIMIMKSFSPMAKIVFQRQRNVERRLQTLLSTTGFSGYSHAFDQAVNKLMWGE